MGHSQRHVGVLLDQKNRDAFRIQLADDVEYLPDDQRRQPYGWLVHKQNLGAIHQAPGDGQHLLLASRQGAGKLTLAFFQAGKPPVHVRDIGRDLLRGSPPGIGAGMEVLLDVHVRKDKTVLGHQSEAS